jgi:hypothetical protein
VTLTGISDSSNVVASGYEDGLLRIVFADGSVYDAHVPAEINAAFLASPSKGKFVHEWLKDKLKPSTQLTPTSRLREPAPAPGEYLDALIGHFPPLGREHPKVLNSHESDPCCGRLIGDALRKGDLDKRDWWECPKCGLEWRPERSASADGMFHWTPRPIIAAVPLLKP